MLMMDDDGKNTLQCREKMHALYTCTSFTRNSARFGMTSSSRPKRSINETRLGLFVFEIGNVKSSCTTLEPLGSIFAICNGTPRLILPEHVPKQGRCIILDIMASNPKLLYTDARRLVPDVLLPEQRRPRARNLKHEGRALAACKRTKRGE
jgi:hypothetical protein